MSVDSCRWWISTKSHRVNITQREVTDVMFFKIYLKEIATVVTRSASIVFHPKSVARVSNMSNTVVIIGFYIDPPMCQNVSNMCQSFAKHVSKRVKHVLNICQTCAKHVSIMCQNGHACGKMYQTCVQTCHNVPNMCQNVSNMCHTCVRRASIMCHTCVRHVSIMC